jgi:alpha-1,3-mannosyltransferase
MATQRSLRLFFQAIALLAADFLVVCGFGSFRYGGNVSRIRPLFSETLHHFSSGNFQAEGRFEDVPVAVSPPAASPTLSSRKGNASLFAQAPRYTYAIVNPSDTTFPRLECPKPNLDRYAYLGLSESSITAQLPKYFFALDLHQCVDLLPRLIGSIVETIRFLGP